MTLQNWVLQENNFLGDPAVVFVTHQTGIESGEGVAAEVAVLGPASPNPARGSFSVAWSLPAPAAFTLGLYDVAGRRVWTSDHAEGSEIAGEMAVTGRDASGEPLPAGCYLLRLDSNEGSASSMVILLGD
jgi:hypothetical protein